MQFSKRYLARMEHRYGPAVRDGHAMRTLLCLFCAAFAMSCMSSGLILPAAVLSGVAALLVTTGLVQRLPAVAPALAARRRPR